MKLTGVEKDTLFAIGIAALYVVCCSTSEALEQDKQKHVMVSAAMATAATVALSDTEHPALYGAAASLSVGVLKELYDKAHPKSHTASGADLAADILGASAGAWLGHGINVQAGRGSWSIGINKEF